MSQPLCSFLYEEITKAVTNKHMKNFNLLSCLALVNRGEIGFTKRILKKKKK